jgi:hypothetical protein
MAKNPKYPESELAAEDKQILDGVVVKYAVKFQALKQKYPDPRVYVKNEIIKNLHSDAVFGTLLTTAYAKNDPLNTIFEPGQVNRRLARDTRHAIEHDMESSVECEVTDPTHTHNFLKPRDLREGVLKKVEDLNIFVHLEGKKEIIQHRRKIKNSARKIGDRGGNPSAYVTTNDVVKIKKIMEKSGAVNYFLEKMNGYGLGLPLTKYLMHAFFYAAKTDKRMLTTTMITGAKFMNDDIMEGNIANFEAVFRGLQSCSDRDIEGYAENAALFLTSNRDFHDAMIFFSVMTKFLNF